MEEAVSIIAGVRIQHVTLLHAASAAALRQKLAQFATVLHISVLPMNPPAQVALGFKLQGFSFLQAQK